MSSRSASGPTSGWYSERGSKSTWAPSRAPASSTWLISRSSSEMARPPSSSRETARSAMRKLFTESEIAVAKSSVVLSRGASASISAAASRMSSSVMSSLTRYSSALLIGRAPAHEGPAQRHLVGVLQVSADREPTGQPGDPQPELPEHTGEIGGGGLTLQVGVGGQDHLGDGAVGEPHHQLADAQLVGPDAVDRRDRPAQHVVAALELAGALDSHDVLVLLDHAQHRLVAPRVAADPALVVLGDVEADRAELHARLDLDQHVGQPAYVDRVGLQEVERDPLRALGPHAREPAELVDEVLDDAFVHRAPA